MPPTIDENYNPFTTIRQTSLNEINRIKLKSS